MTLKYFLFCLSYFQEYHIARITILVQRHTRHFLQILPASPDLHFALMNMLNILWQNAPNGKLIQVHDNHHFINDLNTYISQASWFADNAYDYAACLANASQQPLTR